MITTPVTEPLASLTDPTDDFNPIESAEKRRKRFRDQLIERQKDNEESLAQFCLGIRNDLAMLDPQARQKQLEDTDMMCRYFNGDQYGSYLGGIYQPPSLNDGDFAYTIPVITGHCEQAFMQLLKTQIEYEFSAKDPGDPGAKTLAKMCETVAIEERNRLMTEDARMDEILNSILAGQSQRLIVWGVNPESPKTAQRVKHREEIGRTPDRRECQDCGDDVPNGATACPTCAGTVIKDIPGATFKKQIAESTEEVQLGENLLHIPHPTSVQRDLSAQKLKYSTFIVERDYLPLHVAEWRYQTVINPGSQPMPVEIKMRQEQERSSMQTDAIAGSSRQPGAIGTATARPVVREYIYLDVSRYGHKYLDKEETGPEGEKIPTGFLGDTYPDGLFLLIIGDTILRIKGVNLNWCWSEVLYGKKAGTNSGAGLQIAMPLNDIVNDSFNLEYSLGMTGHPFTVVERKHVKQLPEANNVLFVDNVPPGGIDMIIKRFPGQSSTGFLGANAERTEAAMQFILGTNTLTGNYGAPDNQVMSTATGVAASQENASGRATGPIHQIVYADRQMFFQLLENIKKHTKNVPELRKALEKRFGPDTVELFYNCNFRQTLNVNVAKNTDTPRSQALTQAKAMAFGQIAQAFAKTEAPWAEELLASLADLMGVPFNIGPGRTDRREAEYRLNKLAAIKERISAQKPGYLEADATQGALKLFGLLEEICGPLTPETVGDIPDGQAAFNFLQDHDTFMDVYKDWLFGEECKTSPVAMKLVVIQLWAGHFKAQLTQKMHLAELQNELMPPDPNADKSPADKLSESLSIAFKDLPPDTANWVIANLLGGPPSQVLLAQANGTGQPAAPSPAETEAAKTQSQIVTQEHKAELEKEVAEHRAGLEEEHADAQHARELEHKLADHVSAATLAAQQAKLAPKNGGKAAR